MTDQPHLTVYHLVTDDRVGNIYSLVTRREFVELRLTPTGLIRMGEVQRGTPAYAEEREPRTAAGSLD